MNSDTKQLYLDYLKLTGDKIAAANLVVADTILSCHSLSVPQQPLDEENLSVSAAAKRLNCSQDTIYKLCKSGKLPHRRVGVGRGVIRIRLDDLMASQSACRSLPVDISAKRKRYLGV